MVVLFSRGENCKLKIEKLKIPTTGGGTREECHKGRSSGKLVKARSCSCEHYGLWLYNLLMSMSSTNELNETL